MEIRVLRYFLAVAREQSITRAADVLHVTQPTLSRQLAQLEEEMGVRLFERGTRGISLTAEGALLRRRAEEILELVDKAEREVAQRDGDVEGVVSVGCGDLGAVRVLPELFRAFHARYPGVRFDLYTATADLIRERMERGLTDVGAVGRRHAPGRAACAKALRHARGPEGTSTDPAAPPERAKRAGQLVWRRV